MSGIVDRLDGVITHLANIADNPNINYLDIVVLFSWLQTAFEIALYRRQLPCYDRPAPPAELSDAMSKETFDKAQKYGRDKTRYALIKTGFEQLISWTLMRQGVYSKLWAWSGSVMDKLGLDQSRTITHSLLWISALLVVSSVPTLPWSYYYTFVIEEKHGFNKSTKKLWVMDQVKTWVLVAVFGLPILAGFLKIVDWAGKSFVPWLMLFVVTVQLALQIIYPTFIQPLFNKLDPLPQGEVRERVEKLAGKLGFPLKHLYVIDGSKRSGHSNAYFYGLPWSKHIVIYDTLLEKSTPSEVEAVLGHELGHWYYTHPTKLLAVAQSQLLFTFIMFSIFIHNQSLYSAFGFDPKLATPSLTGGNPQPILIGFMLFQLVLSPIDTAVTFGLHALTRRYEYQADEFAVKLDKKDDLAKSLIKLHITNLSSPHSDKLYSMYHHGHPTLPERLRAMDVYEQERKGGKAVEGKKDL